MAVNYCSICFITLAADGTFFLKYKRLHLKEKSSCPEEIEFITEDYFVQQINI